MEAAGIAREEGAEVPGWNSFKPFAETIALLFGEDCSQQSIAKKVEKLLLDGPELSSEYKFVGVQFLKENNRSRSRCLPPAVRWPALRRRCPLPAATLSPI